MSDQSHFRALFIYYSILQYEVQLSPRYLYVIVIIQYDMLMLLFSAHLLMVLRIQFDQTSIIFYTIIFTFRML